MAFEAFAGWRLGRGKIVRGGAWRVGGPSFIQKRFLLQMHILIGEGRERPRHKFQVIW